MWQNGSRQRKQEEARMSTSNINDVPSVRSLRQFSFILSRPSNIKQLEDIILRAPPVIRKTVKFSDLMDIIDSKKGESDDVRGLTTWSRTNGFTAHLFCPWKICISKAKLWRTLWWNLLWQRNCIAKSNRPSPEFDVLSSSQKLDTHLSFGLWLWRWLTPSFRVVHFS